MNACKIYYHLRVSIVCFFKLHLQVTWTFNLEIWIELDRPFKDWTIERTSPEAIPYADQQACGAHS